jgi:hypothetical protein
MREAPVNVADVPSWMVPLAGVMGLPMLLLASGGEPPLTLFRDDTFRKPFRSTTVCPL